MADVIRTDAPTKRFGATVAVLGVTAPVLAGGVVTFEHRDLHG